MGPGKIYDVNAHSISHAVRESGGGSPPCCLELLGGTTRARYGK